MTYFLTAQDAECSARFYTDVLGGGLVRFGEPSIVALANAWVTINVGAGPTQDKPTVPLTTPQDPDTVSSFLSIRVVDIEAVYREWTARGVGVPDSAYRRGSRDPLLPARPDGYLIAVGQLTKGLSNGRRRAR